MTKFFTQAIKQINPHSADTVFIFLFGVFLKTDTTLLRVFVFVSMCVYSHVY